MKTNKTSENKIFALQNTKCNNSTTFCIQNS